jgi:polyisoprenyl-phosphate glycosyltransferase
MSTLKPTPPPSVSADPGDERALVSIVIPARNEQDNIERLEREVTAATDPLPYRFEFIVVDNASTDSTPELIKALCARDPRWKYVRFTRDFTVEMSITAGYRYAQGQAILVLYSDLQEPPEAIPAFLEKWREGYDVVYGEQVARHGESRVRTAAVRAVYRLVARLAEVRIPPDACDFRLITAEVRDALMELGERVRYLRGMVAWLGFSQTAIPYERRPRQAGQSKMSFSLLFGYLANAIFGFSFSPTRVFAAIGILLSLLATGGAVAAAILALAGVAVSAAVWLALLIVGVAALNAIGLWVVGEYAARSYFETIRRPIYIVSETVNIDRPVVSRLAAVDQLAFEPRRR